MARPNWYVDNSNRAYPFQDGDLGIVLPESAIVDFGCIMGLDAQYVAADAVFLHQIYRTSDEFTIEFRTEALGLAGKSLTFHVPIDAPAWSSYKAEVDISGTSTSSVTSDCGDDPAWEGFLVVGDLTDLRDAIAVDESIDGISGAATIEPSRIQNLAGTFVRSINLANRDRIRTESAEGCGDPDDQQADSGILYTAVRCLTGPLDIKEGYNASIRQNGTDNSITLGASVGAGLGEPCEEVPLHAGEVPPSDSNLLTGGPRCSEIVKSINGVGGRIIRMNAGTGVRIIPGLDVGTLVVDVDLHDMAICKVSSITV